MIRFPWTPLWLIKSVWPYKNNFIVAYIVKKLTGCFSLICSFRPDKHKGMTWIIQFLSCSYLYAFLLFFHQVHNVKNRCYLTDVWHFSKWTWWVHVKLLYDWNFNLIYKRSIFFFLFSQKFISFYGLTRLDAVKFSIIDFIYIQFRLLEYFYFIFSILNFYQLFVMINMTKNPYLFVELKKNLN